MVMYFNYDNIFRVFYAIPGHHSPDEMVSLLYSQHFLKIQ
jgi:hypothetical protein